MAKFTQVAGCRVSSGEVNTSAKVRVERGGEVLHEGKLVSLKHFKDEVKKVRKGQECGIVLANYTEFEAGDTLKFFEMVAKKRHLYEASGGGGGGGDRK